MATSQKLTKEVKNFLGSFLLANPDLRPRVHTFLETYGTPVPMSTLYHWSRNTKAHGTAIKVDNKAGRKKAMTKEEEHLLAGYVVNSFFVHEPVNVQEAHKFINQEVGVNVCAETVRRRLRDMGFSLKETTIKTGGFLGSTETRANTMLKFLKEEAFPIIQSYGSSKLASIDFTYTSHRKDRRKSLGIRGG